MEFQNSVSSNTTDCFNNTKERNHLLVAMASSGGVSFIMCLIAVSVVMFLKLYKHFVYRLALYQVLACLLLSLSEVQVLIHINYTPDNKFHLIACQVSAFFMQYALWVKLLFTLCLVFHIFCLAVCLKDLKKLEVFYILLSLLLPLITSGIPYIHGVYGLAGAWCWIQAWDHDCPSIKYENGLGIIEQFTLWYGPLFVSLTLCLIAVIMIVLVLVRRAYLSHKNEAEPLVAAENRNKTALKELLPLLVYPLIVFVLAVFPLIDRINGAATSHRGNNFLFLAHSVSQASWAFFSGLALLIHVLFRYKIRLRKDQPKSFGTTHIGNISGGTAVYTSYTSASTNAVSKYTIPDESEYEND